MRRVNHWIDWILILSTSNKLKSMIETLNLKNLTFVYIKNLNDLRRINDLIDWNRNSNVELKLIAKILNLNELNSIEFATKKTLDWLKFKSKCRIEYRRKTFKFKVFEIWLINWQNAKKIFLFVCYLNSFQIFSSFFSSKYDFLIVSKSWCFDVLNDVRFFENDETMF